MGELLSVGSVPARARVALAHYNLALSDGHKVGLTIGGAGIPLVFLHGIGLDRRSYLRILNRLPQLGFMVVAIDAAGHGETAALRPGQDTFAERVLLTRRVLDELGIRRAVLLGHSMGGRTAAELAALDPDRALAVVLVNAALGAGFDAARAGIGSLGHSALTLGTTLIDTTLDSLMMPLTDRLRLGLMFSQVVMRTMVQPHRLISAAFAIARADLSDLALDTLRETGVPVAVVHGERDMVVPLASGLDAAERAEAVAVVTLPEAYHSWLLASPWTMVDIMGDLAANELAHALHTTPEQLYRPGAPILGLLPEQRVLGEAGPRRHDARFGYRRLRVNDLEPPSVSA